MLEGRVLLDLAGVDLDIQVTAECVDRHLQYQVLDENIHILYSPLLPGLVAGLTPCQPVLSPYLLHQIKFILMV